MSRARTAVLVMAAVFAVGLLARTPAGDSLTDPPPPPNASASEATQPRPSAPAGVPSQQDSPTDTIPNGLARLNVAVLDPATLAVSQPTLTTVGEEWRASLDGGELVLIEDIPGSDDAQARVVTDATAPDAWPVVRVPRLRDLEWIGASAQRDDGRLGPTADGLTSDGPSASEPATAERPVLAWIDTNRVIRSNLSGEARTAQSLPPGRELRDARLLPNGSLAVLLQPTDDEPVQLVRIDLRTGILSTFTEVGQAGARGEGAVVHAWDLDADRLYVADGPLSRLWSIELSTGLIRTVDLPAEDNPVSQAARSGRLVLAAADGEVAVSGRGRQRFMNDFDGQPFGIALYDANLNQQALLDDGITTNVALQPGSDRIYAFGTEPGVRLLNGRLEEVTRALEDVSVTTFVAGSGLSYAATCPLETADFCELVGALGGEDPLGRQLHALSSGTGEVLGTRAVFRTEEVFLPGQALMVSPTVPE
ncbi:hypothetical protein [Euzebya tangerina]|uniref:hypothetical protein n=1 Tax=Euzebya tangerina TaxID=591198 RepID=UPI000E31308D|nr:hypothetical protein [Euzebya tangerina]